MELSLNWNPSVLVEKDRAFSLKRSLRKLECITGYLHWIQLYLIIAEPETSLKSIKMTDSITHASDAFYSASAWLKHLILCFIQLLKVILLMNVQRCNYLVFYKGKFYFLSFLLPWPGG